MTGIIGILAGVVTSPTSTLPARLTCGFSAKARERVEAMRANGDKEGAHTWLPIIVAITELGTPPTDARH